MRHLTTTAPTAAFALLFCLSSCMTSLRAQDIEVQIEIFPPYPVTLEYYLNAADNALLSLFNSGMQGQEFYLHSSIVGDNGLTAMTNSGYRPAQPLVLPAMQSLILTGQDLADTDLGFNSIGQIDLSAISQEQLDYINFNRALPEGNYQVCIEAKDWATGASLGFSCSAPFAVFYGDMPVIYLPADGSDVAPNPMSHVTIAWEPPFTLAPTPGGFLYDLKMLDVTGQPFDDLEILMNDPGQFPLLDVRAIPDLLYNYDFPPEIELEAGHQYALRVRAVDPTGQTPVTNNGYSQITTFWYRDGSSAVSTAAPPPTGSAAQQTDCGSECEYSLASSRQPVSDAGSFSALQIGYFAIEELSFTQTAGAAASGTGTIMLPFLDSVRVGVSFEEVQIDQDGRIFEGQATAVKDYTYDPGTDNPADISTMDQILRTERLISTALGGRGRTLNLPLGIVWDVQGEHLMLGFNDMAFTPERAYGQVMYNMHYPSWGDFWASLSASNICLLPSGFGEEFLLHPAVDIPLPVGGSVALSLPGTTSALAENIREEAAYLEVDCHGIKALGLALDAVFPRSALLPDSEDGTPGPGEVTGRITSTWARAADEAVLGSAEQPLKGYIGSLEMSPFQIPGLPGLGFTLEEGWADASDLLNPPDLVLPDNYESPDVTTAASGEPTLSPLWEGFYLKQLEVRSAEGWLFEGERLNFSVANMIIDELVTLRAQVVNIADGYAGDWYLSIDTLYLDLVQWSTAETGTWSAGLSGKVGLPISGAGEYLEYSALLLPQDEGGGPDMEFLVQPDENGLSFPFMQAASANICPNSFVRMVRESGQAVFDAQLAGNMSVTFTDPVTLTIPWVDFQFGYHSVDGFSNQAFSILGQAVSGQEVSCSNLPPVSSSSSGSSNSALPAPAAANSPVEANSFPISLEELRIVQQGIGQVDFRIDPRVELGGGGVNGLSADAALAVRSQMDPSSRKLAFDGIALGALAIDIDEVFGLSLEGEVEFYQEEDDRGARGSLDISMPLGFSTALNADFGVRAVRTDVAFGSTADYFGYWYVDGMIGFPGIPLGPGVNLHGLGGGVYVNMQRTDGFDNNSAGTAAMVEDVLSQLPGQAGELQETPSSLRPVPAFGTYGLKLATRLAAPTPQALNMDVSIAGSFAQNIGINSLSIDGEAFLMCPLDQRETGANFWASAGLGWEKSGMDHTFSGYINLYANVAGGMIRGTGPGDLVAGVSFLAETASNKWYFHAGSPSERAGLEVDLGIVRQEVGGYFMVGHGLPATLPVPAKVNSLIGNSSGSGSNKLNNPNPVSGALQREEGDAYYGQAQGIAFGLESEVSVEVRAWALYASLETVLGFDINLTQLNGATCYIPGSGQIAPGINDWYATGQVYAGMEGAVGLKGKFLGKEREFELFQMGAAMLISGGGPNPAWAEGRAGASYRVLNGLIKGSINFDVRVGDRCEPAPEDEEIIPVIYELSPEDEAEDVSVFASDDLLAAFYLPVGERIEVPILWEPVPGVRQAIMADLEIYVDEFSLKNHATNVTVNGAQTFSTDHKALTMDTGQKLDSETDYTLKLRVKATDYTFSSQGVPFKEGNADWKEEREHTFTTGTTPFPIPDDEVLKTLPIRNQRYFLQDEINVLYRLESPTLLFTMNMGGEDYFPASTTATEYEYFFRWASYDGQPPIIKDVSHLAGKQEVELILSDLPRLQNDTYYSCQLVRKATAYRVVNGVRLGPVMDGLAIREDIIRQSGSGHAAQELSREDTLSVDIQIDPGQYAAPNEEIIYQFNFKTSRYNTLSAKLAGASIAVEERTDGLTRYPALQFSMDENFDVFDIEGEYNEAYGGYVSLPRLEFSSTINGVAPVFYEGTGFDINGDVGIGYDAWMQDPYEHQSHQGEAGYAQFLAHSIGGFVALYEQEQPLSHDITLTVGSESRTVTRELPELDWLLATNGEFLRGQYGGQSLTYFLRDRRASGYDGPLTAGEISGAWDSFLDGQVQLGPGGYVNFSELTGSGMAQLGLALDEGPVFTLEYYAPVWTAQDIMAISQAGATLLSQTYLWDAGSVGNVGTSPGNNQGGLSGGGGITTGTGGGIVQVQSADGGLGADGSSGMITGGGGFGGGGTDAPFEPPTTVNFYADYIARHYPALLVQLDNMNAGQQYYRLEKHKGTYDFAVQPDRGFLIEQMLPGPKASRTFQYGVVGGVHAAGQAHIIASDGSLLNYQGPILSFQ